MVIVMRRNASADQVAGVVAHIQRLGMKAMVSEGEERTIIGVIGNERQLEPEVFEMDEGVERAVRILHPFKLAAREFQEGPSQVRVNGATVGGQQLSIMAGPCSVESHEQLMEAAAAVKSAGATILRGGAWKPRTSPYSFQGLGLRGLEMLREAREEYGLPFVTEVMAPQDLPLVAEYADIVQIGARNMNNFSLLAAVGEIQKPVLLKRSMMATVEELLMAAEYILSRGNQKVILCERGIRTFETATRNTFDVSAIPVLKTKTHLPVVADPSHATGKRELVHAMALAAVAAGADGLLIEVHPHPQDALCDGPQSLEPEGFAHLVMQVRKVAEVVGRTV